MAGKIAAQKILIVMPNWLGDAVMATPLLRSIRTLYPDAHLCALGRPLILPVLTGLPFINATRTYTRQEESQTSRWLKEQAFDLAILLPNSFRSAWLAFRARIPQRLGYAREWRTTLLTHRITPQPRTREQRLADALKQVAIRQIRGKKSPRIGSPYQPMPTIDYYLAFAAHLGAPQLDRRMELGITAEENNEAETFLLANGVSLPDATSQIETLITIVPGANFGSSKCWPPERFAAVADRLMDTRGPYRATVLLAGSPAEKPLIDAILSASALAPRGKLISLPHANNGQGVSLGALKPIIQRSTLILCNDTGPRHFAVAFERPVVTLFGPTDPRWAETFYPRERQLQLPVSCGPCQLKKCPIDHRCMTGLTVDLVLTAIDEALALP